MAIKPTTEFPGKIDPADAEYPQGKARNVTIQDDGTGTPWKARLLNDIWGLLQRLLSDASIVPSGNPDTVLVSDYKNSLDALYARLSNNNIFTQSLRINAGLGVNVAPPVVAGDVAFSGKIQSGTVPLARMATVKLDSSSAIAANGTGLPTIQAPSASHRFYSVSMYSTTTNVYHMGAVATPTETVLATLNFTIQRSSAASDALNIINGFSLTHTVFYKVYELTEV